MKKFLFIVLSVISISLTFINTLNAQENDLNNIVGAKVLYSQSNTKLIQQKIKDLSAKLNLTEEQKQKTEEIGKHSYKKFNICKDQFIEEKNKLVDLRKKNASVEKIQAQFKVVQSIKSNLNIIRKKNMREFESILTAEQKKDFKEFKADLQKIKKKETRSNRKIREYKLRTKTENSD